MKREEEKLEFETIAAAVKFITNLREKNRFQLKVDAFLPTSGDKGFQGMTFISVSRRQFIDAVKGMGTVLVDDRGGRIVLHVSTHDIADSSVRYVSMY